MPGRGLDRIVRKGVDLMKSKYFFYYFFFTLVIIGVRGQFPQSILVNPFLEDFFNITGFISLVMGLVISGKEKKRDKKIS